MHKWLPQCPLLLEIVIITRNNRLVHAARFATFDNFLTYVITYCDVHCVTMSMSLVMIFMITVIIHLSLREL